MKKLMNNIVIKSIVCAGIFCGTNFGMYQQQTKPRKQTNNNDDSSESLKERKLAFQKKVDETNIRIINEKNLEDCGRFLGAVCCPILVLSALVLRAENDDQFTGR